MIASHHIQGMIRLALAMLSLRNLRGEKVTIVHVRGHSGDPGNDGADYLARVGASSAAIEDYDWDMRREAVEKNTRDLQSRRIAAPREKFQVLLEVRHLHSTALIMTLTGRSGSVDGGRVG
jgi:hypothetical protein